MRVRRGLSGVVALAVVALVLIIASVSYVYFSGVESQRQAEERTAVALAVARVKEDLVVYLNSSGGSLWVWVRARAGMPRITGYWYVFADGSVSRLHECNILVTRPVPVAPWLSNASDFIVRTAIGNIYRLAYVPKNVTVSNETYLPVSMYSVGDLSGVFPPTVNVPIDTVWSVYFYGSSSSSISSAKIIGVTDLFPYDVPVLVKYVSSKPINVTGEYTVNPIVDVDVPLDPVYGSGVVVKPFNLTIVGWVVKNVTLGENGNATLTIKLLTQSGWESLSFKAGDTIPDDTYSVNRIKVYLDGFLLKSWYAGWNTWASSDLHNLLKTYIFGHNVWGSGGNYKIVGFCRAYYAYFGSRCTYSGSVYVDIYDGSAYAELVPTSWRVYQGGSWVEVDELYPKKGYGTGWSSVVWGPGSVVWGDLGLPIENGLITVGDYGLRANVTVLDSSGSVLANSVINLTALGNEGGLPVFGGFKEVPVALKPNPPSSTLPTLLNGVEVVVVVYNVTSGEVLWSGTTYLRPYWITLSNLQYTASKVDYYLSAPVNLSNYGKLGSGTLLRNGYSGTLEDTGSSYSYVGRKYKVFDTILEELRYAPAVRINSKYVQTGSTTTTTTTSTTTTTTTPPWTLPPPVSSPVTFNVVTPALPADGQAHVIDVDVIGTPMPQDYLTTKYFVASITEYTPKVYSDGSWEWRSYTVTVLTLTPTTFFGDYVLGAEFEDLGVVSGSAIPMGFNGEIVDERYGTVTGVIGNFYNFKGQVVYTTTVGGTSTIRITVTPKPISVTPFAPIGIVGLLFLPLSVLVLALLRGRLGLDELLGRLLREYRVESVVYVASLAGLILLFVLV